MPVDSTTSTQSCEARGTIIGVEVVESTGNKKCHFKNSLKYGKNVPDHASKSFFGFDGRFLLTTKECKGSFKVSYIPEEGAENPESEEEENEEGQEEETEEEEQEQEPQEQEQQPLNVNLLINGHFSEPDLPSGKWKTFKASDIPGWNVEWVSPNGCLGAPVIEIQTSGLLGSATKTEDENGQYAELDSHCSGSREATIRISQTIKTIPGNTYKISFKAMERPRVSTYQNLEVKFDGQVLVDEQPGNDVWKSYSFEVSASGNEAKLEIADTGAGDTLGILVDAVEIVNIGNQ